MCTKCFTSLQNFKTFRDTIITKHAAGENNVPEKLRFYKASEISLAKQTKAAVAKNPLKSFEVRRTPESFTRPNITTIKLPKSISVKHIPKPTMHSGNVNSAPEITPESDPLCIQSFKQEDEVIFEADVDPLDDKPEIEYEFVEEEVIEYIKPASHQQVPFKTLPKIPQQMNTKDKLLASLREKWGSRLRTKIVQSSHDSPHPILSERSMFCDICGFNSEDRKTVQRHFNTCHIKSASVEKKSSSVVKCSIPLRISTNLVAKTFIKSHISLFHEETKDPASLKKDHQCEVRSNVSKN